MEELWTAVGAVSGCLATATVIVALFFARGQVREAKLARDAVVLQTFRDRYHSQERREFRRRIRAGEFGPAEDFDRRNLAPEDDMQIGIIVDELEFLAVMVERNLLDFDLVVAAFRNTPPAMWRYLEPSVRRQRLSGRDPVACVHLERLATRYDEHYLKHHGVRHPAFTGAVMGTTPAVGPLSP